MQGTWERDPMSVIEKILFVFIAPWTKIKFYGVVTIWHLFLWIWYWTQRSREGQHSEGTYCLYEKQGKSEGFDSCDRSRFLLQIGFKSSIHGPMWRGNLMEDLKKYRAPPLYYVKLCASFQSHRWIQTGDTVRKLSIWVKIGGFCPVWPQNLTDDLEK